MKRHCYAISKNSDVIFSLGTVEDHDYLYSFDKSRPEWIEPFDIIFDKNEMQDAWRSELDLFVILSGSIPDKNIRENILADMFSDANVPRAMVRTVTIK